MNKYIEVNDSVVLNTKDIRRVEFIDNDLYLGLLPKDDKGVYLVDYIWLTYAKITTFDNQEFILTIDLFPNEPGETEEEWHKRNIAYIDESMEEIYNILKPVKVDGKEYSD